MQEQENMEQNIPEQNPSFDPNQPVHHSVWIPIVVIAGLVVGYLALAGANDWWPFQIRSSELGDRSQESPSTSLGTTDDDIADWQTYRNEEFGFEVRYPQNAKISEESDVGSFVIIRIDNIGQIIIAPEKKYPRGYAGEAGLSTNVEDILFAGGRAVKASVMFEGKIEQIIVHDFQNIPNFSWSEDSEIFVLGTLSDENILIINQILSTFRFLD